MLTREPAPLRYGGITFSFTLLNAFVEHCTTTKKQWPMSEK